MKKENYIKIAKNVIDLEIKALQKLKKNINKSFNDAVNALAKCQSKVILCGDGKVLIVDADGISTVALLGDMIAEAGVRNNWSGIVINGYVRDIDILSKLDIGVQAIGAMPVRSEKKNQGQVGIEISFGGLTFSRGDYVYADNNGLLLSKLELNLS